MEFQLDDARNKYIEIMNIYLQLSSEKKSFVYDKIIDLYNERKNAERLEIKA